VYWRQYCWPYRGVPTIRRAYRRYRRRARASAAVNQQAVVCLERLQLQPSYADQT